MSEESFGFSRHGNEIDIINLALQFDQSPHPHERLRARLLRGMAVPFFQMMEAEKARASDPADMILEIVNQLASMMASTVASTIKVEQRASVLEDMLKLLGKQCRHLESEVRSHE